MKTMKKKKGRINYIIPNYIFFNQQQQKSIVNLE